jgi:hypothetical protein
MRILVATNPFSQTTLWLLRNRKDSDRVQRRDAAIAVGVGAATTHDKAEGRVFPGSPRRHDGQARRLRELPLAGEGARGRAAARRQSPRDVELLSARAHHLPAA